MGKRLEEVGRRLRWEIDAYQRMQRHPLTPLPARLLLSVAVAYALMPFDAIPDLFPGIGELDDLVFVPLLVVLALALIPERVVRECR